MSLSRWILNTAGWRVQVTVPDYDKCLICVAPHTSNWDFVLCKLAYASVGRHAGFLMKSTWFFPPLGWIFKAMGGVPVHRGKGGPSLTAILIDKFKNTPGHLQIAITPEGTRSRNADWKTGFLHIAHDAGVPIVLAVLDYGKKRITADATFTTSGDTAADMAAIKDYYRQMAPVAKFPQNFAL